MRSVLYLLAVNTGLRAAELASLTPDSFHLDTQPPTVTVEAAYSKRRRQDTIPLPSAIVPEVRAFLDNVSAGERCFPGRWPAKASRMLRADLKRAGIPFRTAAGIADFHSLRSAYVSRLARAGVPLTTTQRLARHSTPTLTAKAYIHLDLSELGDAADVLGRERAGERVTPPNGSEACPPVPDDASSPDGEKPQKSKRKRGKG